MRRGFYAKLFDQGELIIHYDEAAQRRLEGIGLQGSMLNESVIRGFYRYSMNISLCLAIPTLESELGHSLGR